MNSIIIYFSNVPDSHRILLLTISLFLFWNVENLFGEIRYDKWKHALTNTTFLLPDAIVQLCLGVVLTKTISWTAAHQWGVMYFLPKTWSPLLWFLISFVLSDFCEYVYHVIMHKTAVLWRFHLVHHADTNMDVSTTLREHPNETLIRLSFLTLFVALIGCSFWMVILRQFIQIVSNVIAHANIRLPNRIDRIVSWIFITPNVHHVHHHYQMPYTDSNYGDVLSIWDHMFGTFKTLPAQHTIFGIDTHYEPYEVETTMQIALMPFKEVHSQAEALKPPQT